MSLEDIRKEISRKKSKLYYINHKEEVNKKRKNYKRQPWSERSDNPKNKS